MLKLKTFSFNLFEERAILMWDESLEAVIVDPGCMRGEEHDTLLSEVKKAGVRVKAIWLTHGHIDHVCGVPRLVSELGIPVMMHHDDIPMLEQNPRMARVFGMPEEGGVFDTMDIAGGDVLKFGGCSFKVIETPGHTPGSVSFYDEEERLLLSGDTLFAGSIGRTDMPGGNYDRLIVSIMDGLMGLPGDVDVIPGHGTVTSIGYERTNNPFLQPFNEREELFPEE